jgi:uncharacterized protein (TIGR00730 family)
MTKRERDHAPAKRRSTRDLAIDEFLSRYADCPDRDLLAEMMVTVCRLAADETRRGELKLVSRALKELRYAFKVFAPYSEVRKVSIFGSSRTSVDHPDWAQANRFARHMREAGWMVITGAGDGIMRAGHSGAGPEASFGVAIRLPFEQRTNPIIAEDRKLVNFNYFFTRKLLFIKEASAVALFPGGFGTQDEGFETLTLVQTGKTNPVPIVMIDSPGGSYWQHWRTYVERELLQAGMVSSEDMSLFTITDDVDHAIREVLDFYRRYHSARYLKDWLVMRLNSALPAEALTRLRETYRDITGGGQIEQHPGPMGGENGEHPEKPRLAIKFDRKSVGRLRQLIRDINSA